jgi:putative oxidoreductase
MSGAEFARLALRAVVGSTMVAHGIRHGRSLDGTARWFEGIGFLQPRLQAQASVAVEVAAGTAIAAGALTPVAASAVIGTMAVAARTVHVRNGFFITDEGYEYVLTLAVGAAALAALGPGRFSIDGRSRCLREMAGARVGAAAVAAGLLGAAAQLATFWRSPLSGN